MWIFSSISRVSFEIFGFFLEFFGIFLEVGC